MIDTRIPAEGFNEATLNDAGDHVVWADKPANPDQWLLVEGRREPIQGNVLILGPEGSDGPTIDLDWIMENVDFGHVQELGDLRMFLGERHRRPLD